MQRHPDDARSIERLIAVAGVSASIVASLAHWYFDPLPNPDGIIYLLVAQAWLDGGYAAAAAAHPSPVYSGLIAMVHSMSGFTLLTSARCLDAATLAALIVALQRLGRAVGGSVRVQAIIVAAAVLLPELNGYRSFLLRDFGYWLLSTVALTALVHFAIDSRTRSAVTFLVSGAAAALFRAEALALLLLVPAALLFVPERRRFAATIYASLATTGSLAVAWVAAVPDAALSHWFVDFIGQYGSLVADIPAQVRAQRLGFASAVLDPRFPDYAGLGVAGAFATLVAVHVAIAASMPLFAIAAAGALRGSSFDGIDARARPVLALAIALAIAGVVAVLAARSIVQTRYAMSAALLIVVAAAFVIDEALKRVVHTKRMYAALGLLLVYFIAEDGFGLTNSKQYYLEAADWMARHTQPEARVFSSDARILYLAGRRVGGADLDQHGASDPPPTLADYDYVVLSESPRHPIDEGIDTTVLFRVARFEGRNGNAISIYRVHPTPDDHEP